MGSVQLKGKLDKINYELADERIQNIKELVLTLQKELREEYGDSNKLQINDQSEQAQLAKADENIKGVDMEQELKNIEDDEEDTDFDEITDITKLKKIVKT